MSAHQRNKFSFGLSLPLHNLTNTPTHIHTLSLYLHILSLTFFFSLSLSFLFLLSPPPLFEHKLRHMKTRVAIWPFLKQFSRNKMIWPFFNLEENGIFLGLFWLNFNETSNILWYFKISLTYFGRFSLKIWPIFGLFHHLRIWLFKLFKAKFGPFSFLGPGNPDKDRSKTFLSWKHLILEDRAVVFNLHNESTEHAQRKTSLN